MHPDTYYISKFVYMLNEILSNTGKEKNKIMKPQILQEINNYGMVLQSYFKPETLTINNPGK